MTTFLMGAAFLFALMTLLVTWRRSDAIRPADLDDPNLQWYRQRASELGRDAPGELLDEARLRLIEDGVGDDSAPQQETLARGLNPGLWVFPVVLLASGVLYWQLGAVEDVLIYRELQALQPEDEAALPALAERIATRSAKRPDNLQYLGLLGQLELARENYAAAAENFGRLADAVPNDPQAQAQAAQSRFVASGRRLDGTARTYAERALQLDPQQATALGLLGMAAFESGEFNQAVGYWTRLQAMEAEGSAEYQMLTEVIAAARERAPGSVIAPAGMDRAGPSGGVNVSLALVQGGAVAPDAVVFVSARSPAAQSRMPIAVRRFAARELPLTLYLSDADSMAGQRLSDAEAVVITAQISRNGQPGEANAAFLGRSEPVPITGADVSVSIELLPQPG